MESRVGALDKDWGELVLSAGYGLGVVFMDNKESAGGDLPYGEIGTGDSSFTIRNDNSLQFFQVIFLMKYHLKNQKSDLKIQKWREGENGGRLGGQVFDGWVISCELAQYRRLS